MLDLGNRAGIASFDVDAQNCFTPLCPEQLPVPEGTDIVGELNAQARMASLRVGSKDAHPAGAVWEACSEHPALTPISGENVDVRWPRHGVPGSFGFQLLDGLPAVTDYDFFVWKGVEPDMHPYGACYHDLAERRSTGVIEFLRDRDVQTVIVGGLALDYCVRVTALQLQRAGFRVVVNRGACRGLAEETTGQAELEMLAAGIELVDSVTMLESEKA